MPVPLANLQRHERGDRVAERGRRDLRPEPADDAAFGELVQPRLHRAPRDTQAARTLENADPGFTGEQVNEPGIERVQAGQFDQPSVVLAAKSSAEMVSVAQYCEPRPGWSA